MVSDIEDLNDEDWDSKSKSKRKDDLDNNDILQKILNEQSASKCELEEGNVSDQEDNDEIKESKYFILSLFQAYFTVRRNKNS